MAKTHFAIERPRKIRISIDGYDPGAQAKAQEKKRAESRRRTARQKRRAQKGTETPLAEPATTSEDVEALAAAAAGLTTDDHFTQQLREAFVSAPGARSSTGGKNVDEGT